MVDNAFSADGLPLLEESPDEEAWEKYLAYALDRIDGIDANGVTNPQIAELEKALGTMLPFEFGLLIVMGVPDGEQWFRWGDSPAEDLERWQANMTTKFVDAIITGQSAWPEVLGAEPETDDARASQVTKALSEAPRLVPLFGSLAVPVTAATGEASADANPLLSIRGADVRVAATDLAVWLHRQFEVPLPMWPETPERHFAFWSELG